MRQQRQRDPREGFTLVEVLAAFAIAAVIITASAGLVRHVAAHFDRGTRGVAEADRLVLAVERLSADFASARFVPVSADPAAAVAFSAEQASADKPARIIFIGAAGIGSQAPRNEIVELTIAEEADLIRLVRRRAAWLGADTRWEDIKLRDPVVLIEGRYDISFVFGKMSPERSLTWHSSWIGERVLPRFVRLLLRDRASGQDLLGEADFVIRADAPSGCARSGAALTCLSVAPAPPGPAPSAPGG
jgi:prepilin-type N-terminal cleavage/methylation domain-containing protein